ncbi:MAG: bifunctional chorismate mutase/prephenate dehydratase [Clostridia bacterium]|nr:bifunctional chorismate mutase/prephenate dehydratase [Clostridia bacterium]
MPENSEYRKKIDDIDRQITGLLKERMETAAAIAGYKKEHGIPVFDAARERSKLNEIAAGTDPELRGYMALLYSMIFEVSRSYQTQIIGARSGLAEKISGAIDGTPKLFPGFVSVACQGIDGANSQFACDKLFEHANIMYFSDFGAVFKAIEKGLCRYGVVPVENSTAGSVNSVYDLMMHHRFYIVRSIRVKIDHNLLVKPGTKLSDVREIYSHEQAISQCSGFLSGLSGVKVIPCENTAVAAKMVSESEGNDKAALASRQCVSFYHLECLAESVQNTDNNYTRFICISKDLEIYPGADRTSLMLTLPHEQGSLYKLLSKFYALGINLNKLESRPLPGKDFEFMFYFDIDTPVYSPALLQLLDELPSYCESFTYLGSYGEVF